MNGQSTDCGRGDMVAGWPGMEVIAEVAGGEGSQPPPGMGDRFSLVRRQLRTLGL